MKAEERAMSGVSSVHRSWEEVKSVSVGRGQRQNCSELKRDKKEEGNSLPFEDP